MLAISNLPTNHHIVVSCFLQFTSSGVVSPKPNESTFTTTYSYSMKSKIGLSMVSRPFPSKIGGPFWETHIGRNSGPDLTGIIHQPLTLTCSGSTGALFFSAMSGVPTSLWGIITPPVGWLVDATSIWPRRTTLIFAR